MDESKPRLFVLGGRNLHGHVYAEEWEAPRVCLVPIPSMRMEGQSLVPVDTKVESKKLTHNFRASVDAILFSGGQAVNMDCHGQGSESKIMFALWSLWKMSCDFQIKMKHDDDHRIVAVLPDDHDILDDVRMGGFKHQFQLMSHSCALGMALPDGRMLSGKIVLRSRKIRVQDFHTNPSENHVHTNHCGVRRISFTGLGEWELDVLRVIAENSFGEKINQRIAHVLLG